MDKLASVFTDIFTGGRLIRMIFSDRRKKIAGMPQSSDPSGLYRRAADVSGGIHL